MTAKQLALKTQDYYITKNDPRTIPIDRLELAKINTFFQAWELILNGDIK